MWLVGLNPNFTEAKDLIRVHLSQSDEKSMVVKLGKIERNFIQKFPAAVGVDSILKEVEWHVDEEGFHLQGKQRLLQQGNFYVISLTVKCRCS